MQSDRDDAFYWLKCHQYPRKWAGEVYALTRWIPLVGLAAPRVIAHKSDTPAVLMSEMAGATGDTVDLPPHREEALWRQAGMYLARLHTLENDWFGAVNVDGSHQGMPHGDPVAFICHSIENRLIQGRDEGLFDAAEQAFIVAAANDWTPALEGEIPRAIHRDYSPRNWMVAHDGTLTGVI
ncbi:MAG: aminoglycoside phosphotransferase family protein, partial [Armatimonadota bacterium]